MSKKGYYEYLLQLKKEYQEVIDNKNKIFSDIVEEVNTGVYEDVDEIIRGCIKAWYDDYKPRYYKRTYSMYHFYDIKKHKYSVEYDFSPDYMNYMHRFKTRGGIEYLFNTTFVQGYHGGADKIDPSKVEEWGEHPHTGTPWYRTPYKKYYDWRPYDPMDAMGNGAYLSMSKAPLKNITRQLAAYNSTNGEAKVGNKKYNIHNLIKPAVEYILYQYDLFNH